MNPMEKPGLSKTYRSAAVLVVDLVKYSSRDQVTKRTVLRILEEAFSDSVRALNLCEVYFNFTGDGYFCVFLGDSSAGILDFINLAIPQVKQRFRDHKQHLRAGLDYGLVKPKQNSLTGSLEIIGMPGIIATRLEQAASPDTILCSETFHCVFSPAFPEMFSKEKDVVETKDRTLVAYKVLPLELNVLPEILLSLICLPKTELVKKTATKRRILIVDDEEWMLEMCVMALKQKYPTFELETALDGIEALETYRANACDLVLADVNMSKMDGYQLTQEILRVNPNQQVIIMTGLADSGGMSHAFEVGAVDYLPKPFTLDAFNETVEQAINNIISRVDRDKLITLSEDPGKMFSLIHRSKYFFRSILSITGKSNDLASHMLRHKAKQVVRDFAPRVRPGVDILKGLSIVSTQLMSLERLARPSGRAEAGKLKIFIKNLHNDLSESHPKIKFQLSWKNFNSGGLSEAVILLIISELIDNAVFAIGHTGRIETILSHHQSSNTLRILVRDSGPGIPAELKERIFGEGVSTKGEGRGLGLWLIREAVLSLKGDISYNYNAGAEFCVRIPLS